MTKDLKALEAAAGALVRSETESLARRFGTMWDIRAGHALRNATHSRIDVAEAGTLLARHMSQPQLVPLVRVAAIFHAHDGACGDGAEHADAEMRKWPRAFTAERREIVRAAIVGLGAAGSRDEPGSTTVRELGTERTGLGGVQPELVRAIVADAHLAHLGSITALHRVVLALLEHRRERYPVPRGSDGSDVAPDRPDVVAWLHAAADTVEAHRWMLGASATVFPHRESNVAVLRQAAETYEAGGTWSALLEQARMRSGRP